MKEFEITQRGVFVDGLELEVGSRVRHESMPPTLVNKSVEIESEKVLEVATPKRGPGRPPKE